MANYYNLTGWRHTGFDFRNRPYNRDVLNTEYFTNSYNYFQMKGVVVKRDDTSGIQYVDVQGSVKDQRGDQVNAPNATGSQGPGGPWYTWEEVDYIRLARTGYPGDDDFIDISNNQLDPWNAPSENHSPMKVGYYFVVGTKDLARNVTRLYLSIDDWLTEGGASELEIETGYKIRGHITEAEDASTVNTASEAVGLIHPLETKGHEILNKVDAYDTYSFIVSSTDITSLSTSDAAMRGITVTDDVGNTYTVPYIKAASKSGNIQLKEPDGTVRVFFLSSVDLFDPTADETQKGLSALYSAGQLELQDSYSIPKDFVGSASTSGGKYTGMVNSVKSIKPSIGMDITGYPRKADYMFGNAVLYSVASGAQNAQSFANLSDMTVNIWANLAPSGMPYARFAGIKSHPYLYDQTIQGATWIKNAIVLEGASGSTWTQIGYQITQGQQSIDRAENEINRKTVDYNRAKKTVLGPLQSAVQTAKGLFSGDTSAFAGGVSSMGDATASLGVGNNSLFTGAEKQYLNFNRAVEDERLNMADARQALSEASSEVAYNQNMISAPFAEFTPDLARAMFSANEFGLYIINTDADDRARLKNYFRRYGYNGLYKKLTWDEIHVKNKVNFIQCEGVVLKHKAYPLRDTAKCASLLEAGLFLWDEKPNQAAFDNNADAS